MFIDFLLNVFNESPENDAIIWRDESFSYAWLLERLDLWASELQERSIDRGDVVSIEGDFSPNAVALLLALIQKGCVLVPLTSSVEMHKERFLGIAGVRHRIHLSPEDRETLTTREPGPGHPLLDVLRERRHPGLVLFSSGSTGKPKASLHDIVPMLEKFKVRREKKRMLAFLLFDHIGGFNTLFYILSNGGCVVTVEDRSPDAVLKVVEGHRVQILPTSPSFLNMVLLSEAHERYDLSSLERITYGTEVMPESTLKAIHAALPNVTLQQTYGLSELGILRSRSRSPDSLWVKIGGEGFQTRVVDGMLQIKAESAMLGYLNAPSPFTRDGWFMTGDEVEVDGEYFLIKGRRSEIINVGGQKVFPAEVESVIREMDGVVDVLVAAEKNPILGQMVTARVNLSGDESEREFTRRMRSFCKERLQGFQIPQKVVIEDRVFASERFKKIRK